MGLFDKWAIRRTQKLLKSGFSGNYSLNNEEFVRAFLDLQAGYGGKDDFVGATYNAITTWGLYFAKARFRVYEEKSDSVEEIKNHPFLNILKKPNSYQLWWELAYKMPAHWGLFGDAYFRIIRNKISKQPIGFQMLLPMYVTPRSGDNSPIAYYEYNDGETKVDIKKEDILHFRYPDPTGDKKGHAIVSSVADQTEVNALQMHYVKEFFKQGGFMGLTFSTPTEMSQANYDRALEQLRQQYGGKDRAYKIGLLDSDLKPLKASYSIKDMDVDASRKTTKEDIYEAFKIPKILLGGAEAINRATAEAAIFQFTSGVIDPVLNYVDEIFSRFIREEYGEKFFVRHDVLAPKDQENTLSYFESMFKNGAVSLNEWREAEGWNAYDYELASVPIINVGGAVVRLDTGKQIGVEDAPQATAEEGVQLSKSWKSMDEDIKDLRWKQFNSRVESAERRFNRKIKDYTDSQKRQILEAVKDNFIIEGVFNLEEEDMILYQLLEIELYSIYTSGYNYASGVYGNEYLRGTNAFDGTARDIINNALNYNQTTLDKLRGINVSSREELEAELNKIYSPDRANALVTTATVGSFNAGILESLKDAGYTKKIWITMRDSRVRNKLGGENHVRMDGVIVGINEPFILDSRGGQDLMQYPADPNGSPENIINDRCTIAGEE